MATKPDTKIKTAGFTLIELLVVISIIGMLSAIALVSLSTARTRAKYAHAQSDMNQIANAIAIAENQTSLPLIQITENSCTACSASWQSANGQSTCTNCADKWQSAISKIEEKGGSLAKGVSKIINDPWGHPYTMDENETEYGPTDCRPDTLLSGGPDGVVLFSNWQSSGPAAGDDLKVVLPFATAYCMSK